MNSTMAAPSPFFHAASRFFPSLITPTSIVPPSNIASICILVGSSLLTYKGTLPSLIRAALFPPAAYYAYDVAFGPHEATRAVSTGLTLMGLMYIMKAFDICIISFLDKEPPHWVKDGKPVPLPTTLTGRLLYGFDMLSSTRGTSWFPGYSWNWAPKYISAYRTPPRSRITTVLMRIFSLAVQYIAIDAFDAIAHSETWEQPVLSLPFPKQILFSLCICVTTYLTITIPETIYSTTFIALGSNPDTWPPIFNRPFAASSLQDFWSNKWHHIFKRAFDRLSLLPMLLVPRSVPLSARRVLRALIIFGFSAAFHLVLVERMFGAKSLGKVWQFVDSSTLLFFLLQPLGLLIERAVLVPLASPLPNAARIWVTRLWAWGWLLWTGRYWADAWARAGMWGADEGYVGWSPVRGLLYGQWIV
ncbi:hypothetical protein DL93DRAFT_162204 [Clavulina sp. PMI_390]|nr:hypothetical protein DL93DRAFT_162204 [Clavulina sp. PMI_390]